jgi:hypothetical protein
MTTSAPYTAGQAVEVSAHDFKTPGFPKAWFPATVVSVDSREDGKWDVQVLAIKGTYHPQIIGKRGGNNLIRSAS